MLFNTHPPCDLKLSPILFNAFAKYKQRRHHSQPPVEWLTVLQPRPVKWLQNTHQRLLFPKFSRFQFAGSNVLFGFPILLVTLHVTIGRVLNGKGLSLICWIAFQFTWKIVFGHNVGLCEKLREFQMGIGK